MPADRWNELLGPLAQPRENGSAAFFAADQWLHDKLTAAGFDVTTADVWVQPQRLRVAGVIALLSGLAYFALLKRGHPRFALALALIIPLSFISVLEGAIALPHFVSTAEQHLIATFEPTGTATRRLLFTAHVDTKTDLFDHLQRVPFEALLGPVVLLQLIAAGLLVAKRKPGRLTAIARWAALLQGAGTCLVFTAGALFPPSSGALDDGAACAVLVRLGAQLKEHPLEHTRVELVFLASEENGVQGSDVWVRSWPAPSLPMQVVNLEGLGASDHFAVFRGERFTLHSFAPDEGVLAALDAAHLTLHGTPIHRTWYPASTDARSFLARGIPAATVTSDLPEHAIARGLHSRHDDARGLQPAALDAALSFLIETAAEIDRR